MYLKIAQRSPRMIAAMNCVSTIVSTSTLPTINSWAKRLFNVASEIGLRSLPLTRRQTRSCAIPHATRSLTTARSSSVGTNGGLPTFLLEGSFLLGGSLFSMSLLFFMPWSLDHRPERAWGAGLPTVRTDGARCSLPGHAYGPDTFRP